VDINKENQKNEKPLTIVKDSGYENIIKYLVEHGATINKKR